MADAIDQQRQEIKKSLADQPRAIAVAVSDAFLLMPRRTA
jgi:hypothetical protein